MDTSQASASSAPHRYSRLRRESIIGAAAILAGLFIMPVLIYMAGALTLGPHESGSLGGFLGAFYTNLLHATGSVWIVVVGPYLCIVFFRIIFSLSRRHLRTD